MSERPDVPLSDDELKRLLHQAADPVTLAPSFAATASESIARGRRLRATRAGMTGFLGALTIGAVAWGAAAQPWNAPPAPVPSVTTTAPASPSPTPSETPTPSPIAEETTPAPTPTPAPPLGSENVFARCGDSFALPEKTPQLTLELQTPVSENRYGSFGADLRATNQGRVDAQGVVDVSLVIVDATGAVVWTDIGTDRPPFEMFRYLHLTAGDSATIAAETDSFYVCAGASSTPGRALDPGSYEVYGLISVWVGDSIQQQAQGGPWPLDVAAAGPGTDQVPPTSSVLEGSSVLATCGSPLDIDPDTGVSLSAAAIRSPRAITDDIGDLQLTMTTGRALSQVTVFPLILLTQDGILVNAVAGSDTVYGLTMSAGTSVDFSASEQFLDCTGEPYALPPGAYEAHPVLATYSASDDSVTVIARAASQVVVLQ